MLPIVLALLAQAPLSCAEPDGGVCQQQVNAGPYNTTMPTVEGGMGQYTTYLWQSPTSPGTACLNLTKYIGVCSSFARSPYNVSGTGNGGSLGLQNGSHRQVLWSDWSDFSPDAPDFAELGAAGYEWKRVTAYEHVVPARIISCSGSSGVCVNESAPRGSSVRFDCANDLGCEWRPGHEYLDNVWHTVRDGMQVCVRNVSGNLLFVIDTADGGSPELDSDFVGGRWSRLCLERIGSRWVETSRSLAWSDGGTP